MEPISATAGTTPMASFQVVELLRSAVENVPQGVMILEDSGAIVAANKCANAIFGYVRGELVGQPVRSLIPETSEVVTAALRNGGSSLSAHRPNHIVHGLRKDATPVSLDIAMSSIATGHARYVVVSLADLTERLDLEAQLAAVASEHADFQRLVADISVRFAGTNPLSVDELIRESLRRIAEALELDCATLWRKNADEPIVYATHFWVKVPYPTPPAPVPIAAIPCVAAALERGESASFSDVDVVPDPIARETFRKIGLRSGLALPLTLANEPGAFAALAFSSMTESRTWDIGVVERLRLVAGVISQALARQTSEASLSAALGEITRLRERIADGAVEVRPDVRQARSAKISRSIVAESATVKRALLQIEQVAPTPATVLLRGETGTGKEVFAQAIHDLSPRHHRPMVVVSCAAIPTALIESELFGRERGAYTGALSRQIGRFEAANQSTLFLDEIGELPMEMQVKLLRVLQERTLERLGSTQPIKVDVRIIAATHRDLEAAVHEGAFREDLFYRLNVFPVTVPPLRERIEDIPGLVWSFVDEFSRSFGKTIDSVTKDNLRELQSYQWPGNVRELRNVIERAVILSTGRQLTIPVPHSPARVPRAAMTLEALEVDHIRKVLESTNWRVRGTGGAAERLGLKPTTLESRMARLGISRRKAS